MKSVLVSETIQASPEAVFAMASDLAHLATHVEGITKSEQLTEGPVGVGTRWRETRVMFGKEASEEMEFTRFDPPHSYESLAESHGSRYVSGFRFEPDGGGTRVTATFSAEPLSLAAKLMGLLMGPMMRASIVKCLKQDLVDIKTKLEDQE